VFHSKRQQEDDKKAIERGKNELLRLEKQLEVSCAEFTKLQILNQELLQHLEELNARTGSEEYKQKVYYNCCAYYNAYCAYDVLSICIGLSAFHHELMREEKKIPSVCQKLFIHITIYMVLY
jgi:choline kinase